MTATPEIAHEGEAEDDAGREARREQGAMARGDAARHAEKAGGKELTHAFAT